MDAIGRFVYYGIDRSDRLIREPSLMESMQPNPAATVVLVREIADEIEVLMLLRNSF